MMVFVTPDIGVSRSLRTFGHSATAVEISSRPYLTQKLSQSKPRHAISFPRSQAPDMPEGCWKIEYIVIHRLLAVR